MKPARSKSTASCDSCPWSPLLRPHLATTDEGAPTQLPVQRRCAGQSGGARPGPPPSVLRQQRRSPASVVVLCPCRHAPAPLPPPTLTMARLDRPCAHAPAPLPPPALSRSSARRGSAGAPSNPLGRRRQHPGTAGGHGTHNAGTGTSSKVGTDLCISTFSCFT
jgi:hypothetical protein